MYDIIAGILRLVGHGVLVEPRILAWNDNSATEAGFKTERSSGGDYSQIGTAAVNATSYSESGLKASTQYNLRAGLQRHRKFELCRKCQRRHPRPASGGGGGGCFIATAAAP